MPREHRLACPTALGLGPAFDDGERMTDLRSQLQGALGNTYTLERELGGGGMSRVFVAQDASLGREIVVKVLSPDLAAGLNVERFRREIQVAAKLQHPQIVPVLTTGETDGLPYYTMPYIAGESLRARLAAGPLAIGEAVGLLRDVARALAFAHKQGVVHRDIKPENVLLSEGSAAVTDFGIAKAISAAKGGAERADASTGLNDVPVTVLTQIGTSLGTPAYMAPEQVAGDPNTDHRADLYAFGAMAYELLTGRPPFVAASPQKVLAAHLAEAPQPVQELRPDVPPPLADLVMRCLAKEPSARPASAAAMLPILDGAFTTSDERASMPPILLGGPGMWKKALAYYAIAFIAVAVLARAAIVGIGLPDWVFPGALVVMGLGLPVILVTAYVHRVTHRALVSTPARTPTGGIAKPGTMATLALKASPHLSWRRTAAGGMWAVGSFVVLVGAWMLLRALGIGPSASLMAAGKLGERERLLVADFKSPASDSLLGPTVTDAFRTDLAQSATLSVIPVTAVQEVLRRMQRPANARVDFDLAREIATREGVKAVLAGDVVSLGGSYVLSARLVAAQTGEELATFRETAGEAKDIIPTISRLAKSVRSKVGESLRDVQSARTLDRVTTPSLEALKKYVAGTRAMEIDGDFTRGAELLGEAIAIDTGFAMAYRKLAIELRNRGLQAERAESLLQKAYDHRDRLSDSERYLTIGSYFTFGRNADPDKAIAAYESLLELDPSNLAALNNVALQYRNRRAFAKAEEMLRRAIEIEPLGPSVRYTNLVSNQLSQGKIREAGQTVDLAVKSLPSNPSIATLRATHAIVRGRYDSATMVLDSLIAARPNDAATRRNAAGALAALGHLRGQLKAAAERQSMTRALAGQLGNRQAAYNAQLDEPFRDLWYRGDVARGKEALDRITATPGFDSLPPGQRNYPRLVTMYSLAGDATHAREMYRGWERIPRSAPIDSNARRGMLGDLAMVERRYADAIREYSALNNGQGACLVCALPPIAYAYDAAGNADSAVVIYSRYVDGFERPLGTDAMFLALSLRRLAELNDAKGDFQKALAYYARFVELWKDADPDLQPQVRKARARMVELQRRQG
jgi:tetratricopeptide (TPR) repeat protein/TolB-like protein